MAHKITFEIKTGLKSKLKPLRIRIRDRSAGSNIDIRKNTGIEVDPKHFNYKKQTLSVESPHSNCFNEVITKAKEELEALHKQKYTVDTAITNILNLKTIHEAGDELFKTYKAKTNNTESTIRNRWWAVKWVHDNTPYNPLRKIHLNDKEVVKKIANTIKTGAGHKKISGIDNKLKQLDDMAQVAFGSSTMTFRPFAPHRIKGAQESRDEPKNTDYFDFKKGIEKIKTGQDLEATLFYLLSYCLCIDAQDVAKIDKYHVNHLKPYTAHKRGPVTVFANKEILSKQNKFSDWGAYVFDRYLTISRGKEKQNKNKVKFNIYPIPRVFHLLSLVIKKYRPAHSNKGSDPFKLYNFTTETDEGKQIWANINGTYRDKLKAMSGTLPSSARGTFGSNIQNLGVPEIVAKAFLKHRWKLSTFEKFYLKHPQEKLDIIQAAGIDAFEGIKQWYLILAKATELNLIPEGFKISEFDKKMCSKGKNLEKTWQQEWDELQEMHRQYKKEATDEQESSAKEVLGF